MQAETSGAASDRRGFKWRRVRHLSVRDGVSGNFYITGSATGGLPELTPTDCVRVVAYDVAKNWLRYEGAAIPSSESLTHAAIYESDPTISAVIHCHDSVLWRTCLDRVPTTSKAIAYGTPENGVRNHASVHGERCAKQRDFRHGGTRRRHCDFRKKSRRRIRCCDARAKGIIALHLKTVFMNVSPRVMTDELAGRNQERGVTRRRFVGITLASGAALLAGKSDVILGANTATSLNMATNPTFNLGGDFTVNRLGFGAMRVTGEGIWGWPPDRQNALKILRRAVELGVNLIDTADAYGPDTSELLIAEALYPYPKGLVIATKGGLTRPGPGQWVPNGQPEHLKQAVDGSLKRLRLERIDLYQLHTVDPKVPIEESVGALKQMQDAGKIRHVGLSNVDPDEIARARKIVPIVSVQNQYNIEDRKSENVLAHCENENVGFLPWFPIGGGGGLKPENPLNAAAKAHRVSVVQVALAWLLERSHVMLPIPGTSSVAHLEENVAAAKLKLTPEEWKAIDALAS